MAVAPGTPSPNEAAPIALSPPQPAAAPPADAPAPPAEEQASKVDNPDDPAAVWSAVLDRALQKPSWAWLRYVQLDRLDAEHATLRIVPGHREVYGFANETRLAQIGLVIQDVIGRRVRVTLDRDAPAGGHDDATANAPASGNPGAASERREAMGLPLVRQALEIFPEASLIDVREEKPDSPKSS